MRSQLLEGKVVHRRAEPAYALEHDVWYVALDLAELDEVGRRIRLIGRNRKNLLELRNGAGEPVIAISDRAVSSLRPAQLQRLEREGRMVRSPIPTIEEYGGGSVRCMLAEIFLPRA